MKMIDYNKMRMMSMMMMMMKMKMMMLTMIAGKKYVVDSEKEKQQKVGDEKKERIGDSKMK